MPAVASTSRLDAFFDGVIAVIITIMLLLALPIPASPSSPIIPTQTGT